MSPTRSAQPSPSRPWRARTLCTALLLAASLTAAQAQTPEVNASDMVRGALQAVQLVDQARTGELWDGATPAARQQVSRSDFIAQVARARAPLGTAVQRSWVTINRQVIANANADLAGQYVSVEYETRFSNSAPERPTQRELLSFHLDRDGIWRFSGYVLR